MLYSYEELPIGFGFLGMASLDGVLIGRPSPPPPPPRKMLGPPRKFNFPLDTKAPYPP